MVADSGATSSCGLQNEPPIEIGRKSGKVFQMPNEHLTVATETKQIQHELRDPTRDFHITPGITNNSLLSTSKCADAK